jgi:hypothetical protein
MNESERDYPTFLYIGPTIARLGIRRSMLILGSEPPPPLKSLIELKPIVSALFVPTSRCREARTNIETAGTIEHKATMEVHKYHQEIVSREKKVSSERQRVPFFRKS